MRVGAIRKLVYGCAYEREIIHSLKLMGYTCIPVHMHKLPSSDWLVEIISSSVVMTKLIT